MKSFREIIRKVCLIKKRYTISLTFGYDVESGGRHIELRNQITQHQERIFQSQQPGLYDIYYAIWAAGQ